MKMRREIFILCVSLLAAGLQADAAQAANGQYSNNYCFPSYQADRCLSIGDALGAAVTDMAVAAQAGLLKTIAQIAWLLDRGAAFIFTKSVIDNTWIMNVRAQMLQQFAALMPGLLRDIVLGRNGLMYVAVALAGVLMTAPMVAAGERLVKIDRVLAWGAILIVLFISGGFGYDLIGSVENFRQGMVNRIVTGAHLPTDKLILQPMRAGGGDLGFSEGDLMKLPPSYESDYFPEAEKMEISVQMTDSGVTFGNMWIETEQSLKRRAAESMSGVFYAVVSLFGAYLLFIFAVTYILLTFAALILIVFLFAALPLGFFEFGNVFLVNLLGRYMQLVAFSLAMAIFSRWLSSGLGFVTNVNTVETGFLWLIVLVVFIIIMHIFLDGAFKLLTQSAQSFGSDLKTMYGGTSVVQTAKSSAGALIAGGASAAALLAGRPDIAMALGGGAVRQGAGQSTALGAGDNAPQMARGDVFQEKGQSQPPAQPAAQPATAQPATAQPAASQPATAQPAASQPAIAQPATTAQGIPAPGAASQPAPKPNGTPTTAQSEAVLRSLAAQEGWQEPQIRQVREEVSRTQNEDAAVENLQRAPDFERTNAENLRRAVRAAMPRG